MSTCEVCSKDLKVNQDRFCSIECRDASLRKDIPCQCEVCGISFTKKHWQIQKGAGKYCSSICYHKSQIGAERSGIRKRIIKQCVVCGKDFETGGRSGDKDKQFCSNECKYKGRYRSGKHPNLLSNEQAAYLAGFIDGEGSIMINPHHSGIIVKISISNTKKEVLEWFQEILGLGSIVCRVSKNEKHNDAYFLQAYSQAATEICEQILPYLHIKKQQAEIAVEVQNKLHDPVLKADKSWQFEAMNEMKLLNRRGPECSG